MTNDISMASRFCNYLSTVTPDHPTGSAFAASLCETVPVFDEQIKVLVHGDMLADPKALPAPFNSMQILFIVMFSDFSAMFCGLEEWQIVSHIQNMQEDKDFTRKTLYALYGKDSVDAQIREAKLNATP